MLAATRTHYGPPEFLTVQEVKTPTPKDNEVLVRVHAATVNRTDCAILLARPAIVRVISGFPRPRKATPGTDFAGIVEAVGPAVKRFKVGDKVWGFDDHGNTASHAQYLSFPEDKGIDFMPEGVTYEQAAAGIEGAHYAYNFMTKVELRPGSKVLVYGATGAIGSAAVQLLKARDAYVTAVCRTDQVDLVKSLGPDKVVDYMRQDFTQDDILYDFVFDAVGKSTFGHCKPLLRPKGIYISSELGPLVQNPFLALITPFLGGKQVRFPIPLNIRRSLAYVKPLLESGKFKPLIDRRYSLEQIREAYEYSASGLKIGNVILAP